MESVWVTRPFDFSKIKLVVSDFDRALLHHKPTVEELVLAYTFEQLRADGLAVRTPPYDPYHMSKAVVIDHERGFLIGVDSDNCVREIVHPSFNGSSHAVVRKNYPKPIDFEDHTEALTGRAVHPYTTLDNTFRFADAVVFMAVRDAVPSLRERYRWFNRGREHIDRCHWAYLDAARTESGHLKQALFERPHDFLYLPDPALVALYRSFKAMGKHTAIVSNSDVEYVRALSERLGIASDLDYVVGSARKPAYFKEGRHHELEHLFGVEPHEVLYMGDDAYQDCVAPHERAQWNVAVLLEHYPGREGLVNNPILFGKNGTRYETHLAGQIRNHATVVVEGHLAELMHLNLRGQNDVHHGFSH